MIGVVPWPPANTFADERQRMQADATAKLLAQERAMKSEVSQLRGRVTLLEDEGHRLSDENSHLKARADGLQAVSKQLESARDDAIENQNRLRADLKNMQQSVNASYRLESAQEKVHTKRFTGTAKQNQST